jgi:glutathione peroxidase-family protein
VFVVDSDGIIVERFDNVASESELEAAVEAVLAGSDG